MPESNNSREIAVSLSFMFFGAAILYSVYNINVVEGVNAIYTHNYIIPNFVSAVLFDWRGFDTLGECLILINSVLVTGMVFGRGLFNSEFLKEVYGINKNTTNNNIKNGDMGGFTPIIKVLAMPMSAILMVLGIVVILGGHITPGGGFQGGSLIAGAYILAIVSFGLKNCPVNFSHKFLETLESFGALLFLLFGVLGMVFSGYYLLNIHTLFGISIFPSPLGLEHAGIIPYLNIVVGLKVLAGLSTITTLLAGEKIIMKNIAD
ncbi:MnhB domain-containing protein [Methanothermococcus okinawensis]|uniref:Na+/H+ antiporter MnhB subunit-related protein n=1 Tax=Methanothermococcus okinawensis (strain DSM 14208 / JCM 11175 / IH1) TaxID=647113 RepID=F8AJJ5_METOI|nr:MnhB domain-containing protein [Methanothermococcus okinawensis]AEH07181.1 Na+/H+ antiporter MnhB subunit-related protein [Methanothermococcus okinawensis IH1]